MHRTLLFTLIALSSLAGWADDEIKCNKDGTQLELNVCAYDEFLAADKELNDVYQSLIKKEAGDKAFISKLRLAQKAWLAFRDAELEARFACADANVKVCWGSMEPMLFSYRKAELTRERTQHLQQILKEGIGQ
jgi:uncharacterized protein YecT (DUF1311 family)